MRLGQAKREFNVDIAKIVHFLQEKGISISDHPNTKLTEDQLLLVQEAFPKPEPHKEEPEVSAQEVPTEDTEEVMDTPQEVEAEAEQKTEEIEAEAKKETEEVMDQPEADASEPAIGEVIEIKKENKTPKKAKVEDGRRVFTALDDEEEDVANAEVIRAPKQELEGLKVVGKVDIPKPKQKEPEQVTEETKKEAAAPEPQEEPDELAHLHPSKKAKVKAIEKLKEIKSEPTKKVKRKKQKKEKSIVERLEEQKAQQQKKKKRKNPHRHIHKSGESARRIEVLEDGTIVPRKDITDTKKQKAPKENAWKRFWKWFNS